MGIKVIVNGAQGRMGQFAVTAVENDAELNLVAGIGHADDLAKTIKDTQADVVLDLTTASAVFANCETIIANNARPVIGTSGLTADQVAKLQHKCKNLGLGGIIAPNFSIAAVLAMKYAQETVKYYPNVEIIEMHHDKKADSPSGTALKTAEMIADGRSESHQLPANRDTIPGSRGATHQNIPIHAIRLPGLVASQEIVFGGEGETLTFAHHSINRDCFMPGILLCCKKVKQLNELLYGLEHIL